MLYITTFSLKHADTTREIRKDDKDIFFQLLNMIVKDICFPNIPELHNFNHKIAKCILKNVKGKKKRRNSYVICYFYINIYI